MKPFLFKDARKRSKFWYVGYTAADGKRVKKSTGETAKSRAQIVADTLQRAEELGAQQSLTEVRLRDLLSDALQRLTGERLRVFSAEQWLDHFVKLKRKSRSKSTGNRHEQVTRDFLEHLGQRARVNVAAITSKDVLSFRDHREHLGLSPATLNLDITLLSAAFNAALRQGHISVNPCAGLEPIKDKVTSKSTFTPEQVAALVAAADGEWKGAILVGFYTGARLGDVRALRWRDVDLAQKKTITFEQGKTGRKVVVPIYPDLEDYLLSVSAPDDESAFVFPALARFRTISPLSKAFMEIVTRASIPQTIIRDAKSRSARVVRAYSFHSLRHSFATILANAGVPEEVRMMLTGHSERAMHQKYTHINVDVLRDAIAVLPRIK
jgi:integrase